MKKVISLCKDEIIKIVDSSNNLIGSTYRYQMRQMNMYHRCTYIFLYNSVNQYYVQKRTTIKDYCPGYYDLATGGVVAHGENEELSAIRELKEEMGVTLPKLKFLGILPFDTNYDGNVSRGFGYIYSGQYDGPIVMQKEEVADVVMWDDKAINQMIANKEKITPDSVVAYQFIRKLNE